MAWWRTPCTDDEIVARVAAEVEAGRIKPELAHLFEKALREEADGKGVVIMRDAGIRPCPPRRPSWARPWE